MSKAVVVLSGGLDSTTLLYDLLDGGHEVKALTFDYGQRHKKEIEFARCNCEELQVEHRVVDLSSLKSLLVGSALTSDDVEVPEGHYEAESMRLTVVPNRNAIMLMIATGWAISLEYEMVAYAAHAGDHNVYRDCRPVFADAVAVVMELADERPIGLWRPFIDKSKAEIVARGYQLGVPFHRTWSCYVGGEKACGRCGTCCERRGAFELAGVLDPIEYEES